MTAMTTPTTRLAEIAEREAFETWVRSHPDNQGYQDGAAWLLSRYGTGQYKWKETDDHWIGWQGATSAAQARSREDAEIMREAIAQLDFNTEGVHTINGIPSTECWRCKSPTKLPAERLTHTPDCFITKLRTRADELEGRT